MENILKTKEKGNLIVISGPSGAGKGTIIKELLEKVDNVWLSVSMTSRDIRKGDILGKAWIRKKPSFTFVKMIDPNFTIEEN